MSFSIANNFKVGVTSRSFSQNEFLCRELYSLGTEVKLNSDGLSLSGSDLVDFLSDCDGVIVGLESFTDQIFEKIPRLKLISKYGVGLDKIDLNAAASHGVEVSVEFGVNKVAVAELALSLALILRRGINCAPQRIAKGHWTQIVGKELTGAKVGIVGLGNIGRKLIELLSPFDCALFGCDIIDAHEFWSGLSLQRSSLDEIFSSCDIISMHVPLNSSTYHMVGQEQLDLMKEGGILINTARGGLIDEEALAKKLEGGSIFAGLDVLEDEPKIDERFAEHPNCFITPHMGGSSTEAIQAMGLAAIDGIRKYLMSNGY